MKKDRIDPSFTIDDIHKVRERNYERTRGMSAEEKCVYYNEKGMAVEDKIAGLREKTMPRYGVAEDITYKTC